MDISFYVLLVLACMVLLLAMWACASSGTDKWGPDLTLELPPHLLQEAFFGHKKTTDTNDTKKIWNHPLPSAPSELPSAPLLGNEQPIAISRPPPPPPPRSSNPSITFNMDTAVRVLPPRYQPLPRVKPVIYKFTTEPA